MKKIINHKIIFLMATTVVLVLTLVNVSVAWYSYSVNVKTDANSFEVAKWDFIVSLSSGGEPINDTDHIKLNVSDFVNVKKGKMAPGTSGKIDLFITSNSEVTTGYQIRIDKSQLKLIIKDEKGVEHDYSDILQSHIIFYCFDDEGRKKIILKDSYFEGKLEEGKEKLVPVYWEWLYEPDVSMIVDEKEKSDRINRYDEEDTLIGEHNEHITGGIELNVQGVQERPEIP